MAIWRVVAYREFPIWTVARRLIEKKRLDDVRVEWLVEAPETILYFPKSPKGIQEVRVAQEVAEGLPEEKAA